MPKKKSEPRDRIDMRVEEDLYRRIDRQQARRGNLGMSAYIRLAIVAQLEQDEATDPQKRPNGPRGH